MISFKKASATKNSVGKENEQAAVEATVAEIYARLADHESLK